MAHTGGRGVDVVLNSLTGDMLQESWRIVAANGTMIKIGKRDIRERRDTSMIPFNRNVSFRAIDNSNWTVNDETHTRVLGKMFEFVNAGHLKPIQPRKVFRFEEVKEAFRYLRSGAHMRKIIISNGEEGKVHLPVSHQVALPIVELGSDLLRCVLGTSRSG